LELVGRGRCSPLAENIISLLRVYDSAQVCKERFDGYA
jgi:hypothetical protein